MDWYAYECINGELRGLAGEHAERWDKERISDTRLEILTPLAQNEQDEEGEEEEEVEDIDTFNE